jgi:hypothetical protein
LISEAALGCLANGLVIVRSYPACANIFLTRANRKSVCEVFIPPHEEKRMKLFRMGKLSRWYVLSENDPSFLQTNNFVDGHMLRIVVKF